MIACLHIHLLILLEHRVHDLYLAPHALSRAPLVYCTCLGVKIGVFNLTLQARLRFSNEVAQEDIDEALRLMHMSKSSLEDSTHDAKRPKDPINEIYKLVRTMATDEATSRIEYADEMINIFLICEVSAQHAAAHSLWGSSRTNLSAV